MLALQQALGQAQAQQGPYRSKRTPRWLRRRRSLERDQPPFTPSRRANETRPGDSLESPQFID